MKQDTELLIARVLAVNQFRPADPLVVVGSAWDCVFFHNDYPVGFDFWIPWHISCLIGIYAEEESDEQIVLSAIARAAAS